MPQVDWDALREQLRGQAIPGLVGGIHVGGQLHSTAQHITPQRSEHATANIQPNYDRCQTANVQT